MSVDRAGHDVVVAPATPRGRSAIAIVRLSGDGTEAVLRRICVPVRDRPLTPGRPRRVRLVDGDGTIDDGVVTWLKGPATYTGEDTAEIGCHGNPLIVDRLVAAAVAAGARVAEAGELTRRAVLAGKLDLVAAEGVLQLAEARSARGLEVAREGVDGRLAAFYRDVRRELVTVAADLEARLDYPADELAFEDDASLVRRLSDVSRDACSLASTYEAGRVLVEGARVALVGAVNAGKSSLFNALLGRRRALVSELPGTTRDVLEVQAELGGVAVTLLDTAGERETADPIEAAGLALARELVAEADLLVVVLRAFAGGPSAVEREILARTVAVRRLVVQNGVDEEHVPVDGAIATSAVTGEGVDVLKDAIVAALVGEETGAERLRIASERQRDRLLAIAEAADEAVASMPTAGVAVSLDGLYRAIAEIDALTGADTREDVLDALFSRFCIGK